jgi:hypothetical protein
LGQFIDAIEGAACLKGIREDALNGYILHRDPPRRDQRLDLALPCLIVLGSLVLTEKTLPFTPSH